MNITFSMLKNNRRIFTLLATSSIIGVLSSRWIIVWLCLEINTLCICWLVSKEAKRIKKKEERTIIYYLIQVAASIIILLTTLIKGGQLSETLTAIFILIKIGVWPAHTWYIKLISSIEIKINSFIIVITWQKILPATLVFIINPRKTTIIIILRVGLFSLITPLTKISEKINIKRIIALSSLNNNSWLIFSVISSIYSFIVFLSLYTSALFTTLKTIKKMTKKNNTIYLSFWSATLIIRNISGLPPFTIFWAKLMAIKAFLKRNIPREVVFIIIASACLILYHYLWIALNEITKKREKIMTPSKKEKREKTLIMIAIIRVLGFCLFIR